MISLGFTPCLLLVPLKLNAQISVEIEAIKFVRVCLKVVVPRGLGFALCRAPED